MLLGGRLVSMLSGDRDKTLTTYLDFDGCGAVLSKTESMISRLEEQ